MAAERAVTYCMVPAELADKLHDLLRRHFRDEPGIEVIVERRVVERRRTGERRAADGAPPATGERRIAIDTGRRVAERRAELVPVEAPPALPRGARRYARRVAFVTRVEPAGRAAEDADTARVVARFQAGDREAFSTLYTRYYDRVYGYLRAALKDFHEAEDATQDVFVKLLRALPEYEPGGRPFRHWLFAVVRNHALDEIRKLGRVEPVPAEEMERLKGSAEPEPEPEQDHLTVLDWLTDQDVRVFVERLPEVQRRILVLRFMLGLKTGEVAQVLERSPDTVRKQQSTALRTLNQRLRAIGHPRVRERRMESLVRVKPARVMSHRRFALTAGTRPASAVLPRGPSQYGALPGQRGARW